LDRIVRSGLHQGKQALTGRAAVLAERHRRAAYRLAASRQISAPVWADVRPTSR
jgi:hypothetical protein